jgi:hypothetical protein
MFSNQDLESYYNSLPESGKDLSLDEFKRKVRAILDPKRNSDILAGMIEQRHQCRVAREEKRRIDKAQERSRLGLR